MSHDNSHAAVGGDSQYQKGEFLDFLPIRKTDSPMAKRIKTELGIGQFIFDSITKGIKDEKR